MYWGVGSPLISFPQGTSVPVQTAVQVEWRQHLSQSQTYRVALFAVAEEFADTRQRSG
jgi:hypothetical protein